MKVPWRKTVRISIDEEYLENLIKDLLSFPRKFTHISMFQKLTLDIKIKDENKVLNSIYDWIGRRIS